MQLHVITLTLTDDKFELESVLKDLVQQTELVLTADQIKAQLPENLTLSIEDGVLCLYDIDNPQSKLKVDFVGGALSYRSKQHLGAENLIKACQIKGQDTVRVLDATCGLGTDSFLLHQAGFSVTAIEKNSITFLLLLDGINRYQHDSEQSCFVLKYGNGIKQFQNHHYDVIYLDPMFPNKIKSAKNKKAMQLFQNIHQHEPDDANEILNSALRSTCQRVVIKRPTKSPILTSYKPTFQVKGKTCRFDAYQLK